MRSVAHRRWISAETPLGGRFNAKFGGKDYPSRTTLVVRCSAKLKRMSVMPDRKSIHVVFEDKEGNTIMASDMRKETWYRLSRWRGHDNIRPDRTESSAKWKPMRVLDEKSSFHQ
jgi:hypothetical protein